MKFAGRGAIAICVVAFASAGGFSARAADANEYEIAANDGYGLQECLDTENECGRVVADAWCEAHGHGHALSYGARSAVGGAATRIAASDETYVVKCGD